MGKRVRLLGIREAAEILGVNPETLRRWDRDGKLAAVKVSKRGDRRYRKENIELFIKANLHK
jgi:excisionase family DNA binding protein